MKISNFTLWSHRERIKRGIYTIKLLLDKIVFSLLGRARFLNFNSVVLAQNKLTINREETTHFSF